MVETLAVHDKKADMLCMRAFSVERGPHCRNHIPVKEIMGQATLNTLEELQNLLQDVKVGRVAVHGREGVGKTFLMKHLHNFVLKWVEKFDYVFWVSSPDQFSVRNLQDAIATAVKCDLTSIGDLFARASKLSNTLAGLGSFVLFLDGVPKADFSLDQIGIPVPAVGSVSKLVLSTSSSLGCRILDGFGIVELNCLSEKEGFELFMQEAKIDMRSVTLLNNVPRLVAEKCCGVPGVIVSTASHMCGIDDLREWRNALFELENLEKKTKLPCQVIIDDLGL